MLHLSTERSEVSANVSAKADQLNASGAVRVLSYGYADGLYMTEEARPSDAAGLFKVVARVGRHTVELWGGVHGSVDVLAHGMAHGYCADCAAHEHGRLCSHIVAVVRAAIAAHIPADVAELAGVAS